MSKSNITITHTPAATAAGTTTAATAAATPRFYHEIQAVKDYHSQDVNSRALDCFQEVRPERFQPGVISFLTMLQRDEFTPKVFLNESIGKILRDHNLLRTKDNHHMFHYLFNGPITMDSLKQNLPLVSKFMIAFSKDAANKQPSSDEKMEKSVFTKMKAIESFNYGLQHMQICPSWVTAFKNFLHGLPIEEVCTFTSTTCNSGFHPFSLRDLMLKPTASKLCRIKKHFTICASDLYNGTCECRVISEAEMTQAFVEMKEANSVIHVKTVAIEAMGYEVTPELQKKDELLQSISQMEGQTKD